MIHFNLRAIFGVVFAASLSSTSARPSTDEELLQFVKTAHKASRELIRTSHCNVKFEITSLDPRKSSTLVKQSLTGEHWHSADAVRVKVVEQGQTMDYVWKDSVQKAVVISESGGSKVAATRSSRPSRYCHRGDAWLLGLLVVNQPGTGRSIPFEQLVDQASKVVRVERKVVDGNELVAVRLRLDPSVDRRAGWEVEVFFDPSVNYLVRKVVRNQIGSKFVDIEEVVEFKNCGNGIFFPARIAGNAGTDDSRSEIRSEAVLSAITVNQPLPADIFRFRYPNGIYLTDSIRGTSYRVDSDGNPLSSETPLGREPPPSSIGSEKNEPNSETTEEPRSWSWWIIRVSIGLILVGLVLAVRRRRRV